MSSDNKVRVGILGYGHLGRFLAQKISNSARFSLAFVWTRSQTTANHLTETEWITDMNDFERFRGKVDVVVEVCHPCVVQKWHSLILSVADMMIGSPTALADGQLLASVKEKCVAFGRRIFIPAGALWGAKDIQKMAYLGSLKGLTVTMTKHPESFKLETPLKEVNETVSRKTILYSGPVRNLCPLAPNNVNTMAAAAVAADNLGFDKVCGQLVSDPNIEDCHIVEIEVESSGGMTVTTKRVNPAPKGDVTGIATYNSFYSSLTAINQATEPGLHIC